MDRKDLFRQCRLCSSNSILIQLFKGKNTRIKNYIRKLIEITTSIKYEEHDYFGYVCYNCIVHIFNTYVFRKKSLINVERLQGLVPDNFSNHGKKKSEIQLKDIELIEYEKLKCILAKYMLDKLENYSSDSTSSSKNLTEESNSGNKNSTKESNSGSKNSTKESNSKPVVTSLDFYTQTEPPHQHSVTIQTISKATVTTIYTQTEQSTRNKSTQCEIKKLKNKSVNCKIQEKKRDKSIQMVNKRVQCDNETNISAKEPNKHSECVRNKINNIINNSNEKLENQAVRDKHFLPNGIDKPNSSLRETNVNSKLKGIDKPLIINCSLEDTASEYPHNKINNIINNSNEKLENQAVPDEQFLPNGIDKPNSSLKETNVNSKLKGIDKPLSINCSLEDTASEYPSPIKLEISPVPSVHLSTSRSSELLELTKKVIPLHTCKECDLVMYSYEVRNHKKNHMKCNFCQKTFRSIKKTKEHYEVCKWETISNQPYVSLERVEIPDELEEALVTPPKKKIKT